MSIASGHGDSIITQMPNKAELSTQIMAIKTVLVQIFDDEDTKTFSSRHKEESSSYSYVQFVSIKRPR